MNKKIVIGAFLIGAATAAPAQNIDPPAPAPAPTFQSLSELEYPVVEGDITDRPYRVVATIEVDVRKTAIFSRDPSQRHVYRELWERAQRLGADAVVNARFGDPRVTALSWGARRSQGQAIKFLSDEEIAQLRAEGRLPPQQ